MLLRAAAQVPFWTYVREAFDIRDFEPLYLFAYRPLYFISNDALYVAFGLNPVPYHLATLGCHLANVLLTFYVARRISGSLWIGYGAAAIFGLHPVYAFVPGWIAGLNSAASTTGMLLSVAALIRYYDDRRASWLAAAWGAYVVALLFHQEVFLGPPIAMAYFTLREEAGWRGVTALRTVVPAALFGGALLAFVAIQRQNAASDDFEPSLNMFRMIYGVVAISAFPDGGDGFTYRHGVLALVVSAAVLGAGILSPRLRFVLAFAAAWFFGSMLLSVLFFDYAPPSLMQLVISRKVYPAGPALALCAATCVSVYWEAIRPRLGSALLVPPIFVLVAGTAFAFVKASDVMEHHFVWARATKDYRDELVETFPTLAPGTTLYAAGTPIALLYFNCISQPPTNPDGTWRNVNVFCYLEDLIAVMYGDNVRVVLVSIDQATSTAFRASLKPNERLFCYRC